MNPLFDLKRLGLLNKEIYRFSLSDTMDLRRLSGIALELVALRGFYDTIIQGDSIGEEREKAERVMKHVQQLERCVARLYMASRLRELTQSPFSKPPIMLAP